MQTRSQVAQEPSSSVLIGHVATEPSSSRASVAPFAELVNSGRPQRLEAQQLILKSSTTLLKACSPRVSSAQALSPRNLSSTVFEELNYSTQTLNSGHFGSCRTTRRAQVEAKVVKNEYSLRKKLHMPWVPSQKKKSYLKKNAEKGLCIEGS